MKVAKHTKRFGNVLVRYDKENNRCVIKMIYNDDGKGNDLKEVPFDPETVKPYAKYIEETEYFRGLEDYLTEKSIT